MDSQLYLAAILSFIGGKPLVQFMSMRIPTLALHDRYPLSH
jgi:hypothetical protein